MGETTPRSTRRETTSAVLTPPTGLPSLTDLAAVIPVQRRSAEPVSSPPVSPIDPPSFLPDAVTVVDPCTCGHGRADHQHYRPGSDCGICGAQLCASFRRRGGRIRRALRRLGLMR